jgi:hypothetical protein
VLGVRTGQRAGELLGLALPRSDKLMLAVVEIDGCFADGVSVATGCWFGRRTLRFGNYGKVGATFIDLQTWRAARIWPDPQARMVAGQYVPDAADRWHAQLEGHCVMLATEMASETRSGLRRPAIFDSATLEQASAYAASQIVTGSALGRVVQGTLTHYEISFLPLTHPAARGGIRNSAAYQALPSIGGPSLSEALVKQVHGKKHLTPQRH